MTFPSLDVFEVPAACAERAEEIATRIPPWTRELLAHLPKPARAVFLLHQAHVSAEDIGAAIGRSQFWVRLYHAEIERRVVRAARAGARLLRPEPLLASHADRPPVPIDCRASLDLSIDEIVTSVRTANHLWDLRTGLHQVGELVDLSMEEAIKHLGLRAVRELMEGLGKLGLRFGMDVGDWVNPLGHRRPVSLMPRTPSLRRPRRRRRSATLRQVSKSAV